VIVSPQTGPAHSPMLGCYSFNEKGHKRVQPWCQ